jgi:hypothetical protein
MTNQSDERKNIVTAPPESAKRGELASPLGMEYMERFAQTFEASARRWELVVYPSLFAFIILAAYGFYLIYSLTTDVATLAQSVDHNMAINMRTMAYNISELSENISIMTGEIEDMADSIDHIDRKLDTMEPMLANIAAMNGTMQVLAGEVDQIRHDFMIINQSISRPMGFMNSFMPW